ncbi:uncharacterized protein LOC111074106, partial [Drosophila obscura]|uniref:uncharacterized protein LOC111074106 n=1 Tax=Drosophila obscura TaxID=7282 RepID=UPI001BB251AF
RVLTDIVTVKANILTAVPLELAANAIDTLCSSTLFMDRVPPKITPDINKMHFQYMTPCHNYSVPLLDAAKLWNHSKFGKGRKVVILATGWTNTVNESSAIAMMSRAFMCRRDVLHSTIVDAADYVDTLYSWSALNTDLIGAHPIQPGCLTIGCSHTRAVEYFAESAYPQQENNFMATKCSSWDELRRRDCSNPSSMGYIIEKKARGIYYVDVNGWPPYGRSISKAGNPRSETYHLCRT